ncbi:MAG: DUF1015 family protein [Butyricicoccus sp.]
MANRCTRIPEIMFPHEGVDLSKWAVIACDQYTSQPDYWAETDKTVGDAPSTLRLTLPEVYLEDADVAARTEKIHPDHAAVCAGRHAAHPARRRRADRALVRRLCPRRASCCRSIWKRMNTRPVPHPSSARPKDGCRRIPPRLKVRQGACLELPHIMILIDDPDRQIIEPLFEQTASYDKLYDTDLMQNGGHITGWFPPNGPETRSSGQARSTLRPRDLQQEVRLHGRTGAAAVCSRRRQPLHGHRKGVLGKRSRRA